MLPFFQNRAFTSTRALLLRCGVLLANVAPTGDSGSALVEFAASAVLLFTLLFGIIECSRAVYVNHFLANAAQEATRYAMVRGGSWTSACASSTSTNCTASSSTVTAFVQSIAAAGVSKANLNVSTTYPGTNAAGVSCNSTSVLANSVGCVVSVKITYPFSYVSPLLPKSTLSLSSTSQVTIVQ
ncbi:MAG: TadE/TadG family type IV pilus assembly protein [Janthinobacterium lividum]